MSVYVYKQINVTMYVSIRLERRFCGAQTILLCFASL